LTKQKIARLQAAAEHTGKLTETGAATAACGLAAFELFYGSAQTGLEILGALKIRDEWPEHLVHRVRLLRGGGSQRMGHWDSAEFESRQAHTLAKTTNDTLHLAAVLANLACIAVERGSWDEALAHTEAANRLHRDLSTALDVVIPLRLNEANLAFYQGQARKAHALYLDVHQRVADSGQTEFKTEVEACLGLTSLQLGDTASVKHWRAECATAESSLAGMQERFKAEWFWGYFHRRDAPESVHERFSRVASDQETVDRISCLKLRWLKCILLPTTTDVSNGMTTADTRRELLDAGLGWFVHFSHRWLRLAGGCRL